MDEDEFGNPIPLSGEDDGDESDEREDEGADANDTEGVFDGQSRNEDAAAPVAAAEEPFRAEVRPFQPTDNPALNAIAEQYSDPNLANLIRDAIRHEQNQGFAVQSYATGYIGELQAADPDYYRENAAVINQALAELPIELRGTKRGAWLAWQAPYLYATDTKPLSEVAKMQHRTQSEPARQPQRQLTPQERIPSPTGGGGGGRQPRTEEAKPATPAGTFAKIFKLSEEGAKDTLRKMRR